MNCPDLGECPDYRVSTVEKTTKLHKKISLRYMLSFVKTALIMQQAEQKQLRYNRIIRYIRIGYNGSSLFDNKKAKSNSTEYYDIIT